MEQPTQPSTGTVIVKTDKRREDLRYLGAALHSVAREAGFSKQQAATLEISLTDVVQYTLQHAYDYQLGHQVQVRFAVNADQLQAEICDRGASIKNFPERAPKTLDPHDGDQLPDGGLGLFGLFENMDKVFYEAGPSGNCLRVWKRLPSASPG